MSKKIKSICLTLAVAAAIGVSVTGAGCTVQSKHPNVKFTIEFNSETYEIDYTLYRNMYPQTVQHFIELADSGFYNDTIIHDYKSSDWVGGAYAYDGNEETGYSKVYGSAMGEYLENHSLEKEYYQMVGEGIKSGSFTASVYSKSIYNDKGEEIVSVNDALSTLIGEFSQNGHKIKDNKGLTASYGSLKMMYNTKEGNKKVYVKDSFGDIFYRDYHNNCATSLFSMQMSNSSVYAADKYCVFGQLKDDGAKDELENLTDAIYDLSVGKEKFTATVETKTDKEDKYADDSGREIDVKYTVISVPIIIRKIEVTKY